ncbi:MFS transporter [Diaminobutyricimonas sp. LJ205]|uniref:MFS transporter n=1 Tax=Diaminobutyricimonas sp. LJ205 TaxID=2683590 RepID=UPI0012F49128|nr:MFS transporter [Diaminobutyricimonas sp. LJ205]
MRGRLLLPTLALVTSITALVTSLGAPLVPALAVTFIVSFADAQWTLTIALLAGAISVPLLGRLATGSKATWVVIVTLALVGSGLFVAAITQSFVVLLVARGVQGIGLGLVPVTMTLARRLLPASSAPRALAILSVSTLVGAGFGYPLAAWVAEEFGVSMAYFAGMILVAATIVLVFLVIPRRDDSPRVQLDWPGVILLGIGVCAVLLLLSSLGLWQGWAVITLIVTSIAALAAWVGRSLHTAAPLVDLRLALRRDIGGVHLTGALAGTGMYVLLSVVMLVVQAPEALGGFAQPITIAGLLLVPYSIMSLVGSYGARALSAKGGPATTLAIGCLAFAVAMLGLVVLPDSLVVLFLMMTLAGVGGGGVFAMLPIAIARAVPFHELGSALAFNQLLKFVGFASGSALAGAMTSWAPAGGGTSAGSVADVTLIIGGAIWILAGLATWLTRLRRLGG